MSGLISTYLLTVEEWELKETALVLICGGLLATICLGPFVGENVYKY